MIKCNQIKERNHCLLLHTCLIRVKQNNLHNTNAKGSRQARKLSQGQLSEPNASTKKSHLLHEFTFNYRKVSDFYICALCLQQFLWHEEKKEPICTPLLQFQPKCYVACGGNMSICQAIFTGSRSSSHTRVMSQWRQSWPNLSLHFIFQSHRQLSNAGT